ncbi:MAG: very short patch repair endonuclease [Coriobacteriaceae bacterium]|nr:very short patch repair endonuclease [Coriobacteriaceae bacterium]
MKTNRISLGIVLSPDAREILVCRPIECASSAGAGAVADAAASQGDFEVSSHAAWEFPATALKTTQDPKELLEHHLAGDLKLTVDALRDYYSIEIEGDEIRTSLFAWLCVADEKKTPSAGAPAETQDERGGGRDETAREPVGRIYKWVPRTSLATLSFADVHAQAAARIAAAQSDEELEKQLGTRAHRKKSMQGNKRANTKPEMLVRQRLRAAGYTGYRLQWKKAPGRPDIAFPGRKIAIFVNGCFWHRCPICKPSMPKSNVEFWQAKFRRNVERDAESTRALKEAGWHVITIWECELKKKRVDETMKRVLADIERFWI